MSGVEVTGLVLAAIPFVVSGLEHYGEGVRTIRSIKDYPRQFATLARQLRIEERMFLNTIEKILTGCVDDNVVLDLLETPVGDAWSDPVVEEALRRRLGRSFDLYIETIKSMCMAVEEFRDRLKLDGNGKVPFTDSNSFREAYKRFKFGLKRSAYADLLERISKDNTALDRLAEQDRFLTPLRKSRGRIDFSKFRSHVTSVLGSLQDGMHKSCRTSHRAYLHISTADLAAMFDSRESDPGVRIVIHHQHSTQVPLDIACEETELRLLESSSSGGALAAAQDAHVGGNGAVQVVPLAAAPLSGALPSATQIPPSSTVKITDVCQSMSQARSRVCGTCLGYLLDSASGVRHGLYWPIAPVVDKSNARLMSLADILVVQRTEQRLSVGQCRQLAANLAYGMLRLYGTPWLDKQWGGKEVIVFERNGQLQANNPFISTCIVSGKVQLNAQGSPYFAPCIAIKNETVFALGILLIELCLQQPFSTLLIAPELNPDGSKHTTSDFLAAIRLLERVDDTAGRNYGDAVRRCVVGAFDGRDTSLDNAEFRRSIFDGVVKVLQNDVDLFFGR